jgi:alkylation response protein AidB-like acyl-CoA dehydrogenase
VSILKDLVGAPLDRGEPRLAECPYEGSVDRALWGGLHADRLGFACATGYGSALRRLFAHAGAPLPDGSMCLAATESGGAHPRAMNTTLREENGVFLLRGEKTFATLASRSDAMLVVASRGTTNEGKNQLVVVCVPRSAKGVAIQDRPPTPFAPEIPHAIVRFDDVALPSSAVLPGDGYERWVKPFRTIEDTHVLAATVGYLAGVARAYGFERTVLAELVAHAAGLTDVGARDPSDAVAHVLLAGLFSSARKLAASLDAEWHHKVTADERERWLRDMSLLLIAENARTQRTVNAFVSLSLPG